MGFDVRSFSEHSSASPHIMDPRGLRVTKNAYFLLLTHTCQATFNSDNCNTTPGIGSGLGFQDPGTPYGRTDTSIEMIV